MYTTEIGSVCAARCAINMRLFFRKVAKGECKYFSELCLCDFCELLEFCVCAKTLGK